VRLATVGLDSRLFGTHSLLWTGHLIHRWTGSRRARVPERWRP